MDIVFFLYGFSFLLMGQGILFQPRERSRFELAGVIWLLAAFGLSHGADEFLDMWIIIKGENPGLDLLRFGVLAGSFLFLFEFGRRLVKISTPGGGLLAHRHLRYLSAVISLVIAAVAGASSSFWATGSMMARYLLGFPGAALTGWGFYLYAKHEDEAVREMKLLPHFRTAAAVFLAYGLFAGLVVRKGPGFPANWINEASFLSAVGIPVQFFRAACALLITCAVIRILSLFRLEAYQRLQQALEGSSARLEHLLSESATVIYGCGVKAPFGVTYITNNIVRVTGWAPEDFVNNPRFWAENIHPDDAPRVLLDLAAVNGDGDRVIEYRWRRKDGAWLWMRDELRLVRDAAGRPAEMVGNRTDVTARKKAEEANLVLERRLRLLSTGIEQSAESITITDAEGVILYVNPSYERVTGYSRAEVLGQKPSILKSGRQDRSFYEQMWVKLTRGEVWIGEFVNRNKNGEHYVEEGTITPIRDAAGVTTNYISVRRDVSKERILAEQLRQSQKMDAVGRLAGGVAHDFNNILTAILGYCTLLRDQVPSAAARADLDEITASGERAAALTRQLLAFSRKEALSPKVLDLNAVVADTERMLQRVLGENVALDCRLSPELGWVKADKSQLEQVILNLAVNARDAMPGGGSLTIETANRDLDEEYCKAHPEARPGRHAMLAVTDTGAGMDARTLARIFEPFFTTKEAGRGTGLGLSMVYGIARQSGGHVAVQSEPGRGARFEVYLPVVTEAPETEKKVPAPAPMGAGALVLLVEDEEPLRRLVVRMLSKADYTVLEAGDAESALALFQERGSEIRLLLTDVVLPKNSGRWLAEKLLELKPSLGVLYTSGYTDAVIAQQGAPAAGARFLPKPFTAEILLAAVHAALEA